MKNNTYEPFTINYFIVQHSFLIFAVISLCEMMGAPTNPEIRSELRQVLCEPKPPTTDSAAGWWSQVATAGSHLAEVLPYLLAIPNSNAATERSFSILKHIHTPARNSLALSTINSLLHIKVNKTTDSHIIDDKISMLLKCKKATKAYNDAHQ